MGRADGRGRGATLKTVPWEGKTAQQCAKVFKRRSIKYESVGKSTDKAYT